MSTPGLETATWRKSSYSGQGGNCLEVADGFPGILPVRDSKALDRVPLVFDADAWSWFVGAVKGGALPAV
ncbi:DUF397 domain-containing protein [Streptomyces muensis]|uniref:DUF397 domain-containing protein n=1 Tax=Streptomyces muensis TaxID=1077944 RepID=A0A9X1PVL8_STRM4|nr:DUF397 domain-containing protein [Streptomyces muensis]MCF1594362.1 DUF397 domain-containing protein [Streptomyces muensis]